MPRNYAREYEREQQRYRRMTIRIPTELANAFFACCDLDGVTPSDWILNQILEYAKREVDLGIVNYQGFNFRWEDIVSEMDPQIYEQLRATMPSDATNEEFLEEYGELDPKIYEVIDPFGAPVRPSDEDK